ncbi:MAG: hypothetical protein RRY18_05005 [Clostridia bacterium]
MREVCGTRLVTMFGSWLYRYYYSYMETGKNLGHKTQFSSVNDGYISYRFYKNELDKIFFFFRMSIDNGF